VVHQVKAYVYPDGSVYSEPASDMSDDYFVVTGDMEQEYIARLIGEHFDEAQLQGVFNQVIETLEL